MTRRTWTLFAVVCFLWGIPYVFIKIAVEELTPAQVAFARLVLGFAVLLPFALRRGAFAGLRARWRWLLGYSVVELAIAWPLIGFGETRVSASLTAVLLAAVPLILALMMRERPSGTRGFGLLLGFVGVIALLGLDVDGSTAALVGALAVLGAAVCYAAGGWMIGAKLGGVDPVGAVTASFGVAALVLAPAALVDAPTALPSGDVLASIAVLGVACSALAFLSFFALIAAAGATRASVITYVLPLVAVAFGVTALGEEVRAPMAVGMALILLGSWFATGGRLPRRRARLVEATA
jgi:drug/metabolite transporter (DMT)-like permease